MEEKKNISENKVESKKVDKPQEPQNIAFSVTVLEDGAVIVVENGKYETNVSKIEFYADNKTAPTYSITKTIKRSE